MTHSLILKVYQNLINCIYLIKKEYLKKLIKFFGYKDYVLDILIIGGGNIGQNLSKLNRAG